MRRPGSTREPEMSVYETTPRPLPLGTLTTHRVVTAVEQTVARLNAWRRARLTEAALRDLSDTQLADIGVSRGDIADFADSPARRGALSAPAARPAPGPRAWRTAHRQP